MIIPDRIYKEKVESRERQFFARGNKIDQTKYIKGLNVQVSVMFLCFSCDSPLIIHNTRKYK